MEMGLSLHQRALVICRFGNVIFNYTIDKTSIDRLSPSIRDLLLFTLGGNYISIELFTQESNLVVEYPSIIKRYSNISANVVDSIDEIFLSKVFEEFEEMKNRTESRPNISRSSDIENDVESDTEHDGDDDCISNRSSTFESKFWG